MPSAVWVCITQLTFGTGMVNGGVNHKTCAVHVFALVKIRTMYMVVRLTNLAHVVEQHAIAVDQGNDLARSARALMWVSIKSVMRKWAIKRYKAAKSQRACHSLLLTTSLKPLLHSILFPYVCFGWVIKRAGRH